MIEPNEDLANGVILQAVKDYRKALRKLCRRPDNEGAWITVCDCEAFFRSEWFSTLTRIDGEMLIRKLKEEIE